MNHTIDYYNRHAQNFMENTQNADMHLAQDKFLGLLFERASILDFGCGSGRDTKYFLDKGYAVTATDGSAELCRLASEFIGITVKNMLFQDLCDEGIYDGIWACASILHLPKAELLPVMQKMSAALKENGVIYTSFKYGTFEGERNGRYFTGFTENSFKEYVSSIPDFTIEDCWISEDVRPGRSDEKWLNLLLCKTAIR